MTVVDQIFSKKPIIMSGFFPDKNSAGRVEVRARRV